MWCVRLWGVGAGWQAVTKGIPHPVPICVTLSRNNHLWSWGHLRMDKKELIEGIREINKGATPEFLASFSDEELRAYLDHLMEADVEEELTVAD
jgi:hypothetical protein